MCCSCYFHAACLFCTDVLWARHQAGVPFSSIRDGDRRFDSLIRNARPPPFQSSLVIIRKRARRLRGAMQEATAGVEPSSEAAPKEDLQLLPRGPWAGNEEEGEEEGEADGRAAASAAFLADFAGGGSVRYVSLIRYVSLRGAD